MENLIETTKVSEKSTGEMVQSNFLCSIPNYNIVSDLENRRTFVVNRLNIGSILVGKLIVFPMGIDDVYDGSVSMILSIVSENLKSLDIEMNLSILDSDGDELFKPSFDYDRKPGQAIWTVSNVADSSWILDPSNDILEDGALHILIGIQINKRVGQKAENRPIVKPRKPLAQTEVFGNIEFLVRGVRFYAQRDILASNYYFASVFWQGPQSNGVYVIDNINPEDFGELLMEIYAK